MNNQLTRMAAVTFVVLLAGCSQVEPTPSEPDLQSRAANTPSEIPAPNTHVDESLPFEVLYSIQSTDDDGKRSVEYSYVAVVEVRQIRTVRDDDGNEIQVTVPAEEEQQQTAVASVPKDRDIEEFLLARDEIPHHATFTRVPASDVSSPSHVEEDFPAPPVDDGSTPAPLPDGPGEPVPAPSPEDDLPAAPSTAPSER